MSIGSSHVNKHSLQTMGAARSMVALCLDSIILVDHFLALESIVALQHLLGVDNCAEKSWYLYWSFKRVAVGRCPGGMRGDWCEEKLSRLIVQLFLSWLPLWP